MRFSANIPFQAIPKEQQMSHGYWVTEDIKPCPFNHNCELPEIGHQRYGLGTVIHCHVCRGFTQLIIAMDWPDDVVPDYPPLYQFVWKKVVKVDVDGESVYMPIEERPEYKIWFTTAEEYMIWAKQLKILKYLVEQEAEKALEAETADEWLEKTATDPWDYDDDSEYMEYLLTNPVPFGDDLGLRPFKSGGFPVEEDRPIRKGRRRRFF